MIRPSHDYPAPVRRALALQAVGVTADPLDSQRQADGADLLDALTAPLTAEELLAANLADATRGVPSATYLRSNVRRLAEALHNALVMIRRQRRKHDELAARVKALEEGRS